MTDDIWAEVLECFNTDDGSLPGIEITALSPAGLSTIYSMLRKRSQLVGDPPEFWNNTKEITCLVDSVPDAAGEVASGRATPFHHNVGGIIVGNVELPVLGIFVFQDTIELDYRMGNEWDISKVKGFFELLWDCCSLDHAAVVLPAQCEGPPYPERFTKTWSAFCKEHPV